MLVFPNRPREPEEVSIARYFAEMERFEQRYASLEFHLANWDTDTVVALVRASKRPASAYWLAHGISHEYIGFGVAYGDKRDQISCMSIGCYHDILPSALFVKDSHPELLACLDQYESEEWLYLSKLAMAQRPGQLISIPLTLFTGAQPIHWRIPAQRRLLQRERPLQIATTSISRPSMEQYKHINALMARLGPRSVLIDLRSAPDTHRELQRRLLLKRNMFRWPTERAAQFLHPIGLRDRFGMKYRHIPGVIHFARHSYGSKTDKEWLLHPEQCDPIDHLITAGYPLLLVDEPDPGYKGLYRSSLRRAIVLHLLSLFAQQIEVVPEEAIRDFVASPVR